MPRARSRNFKLHNGFNQPRLAKVRKTTGDLTYRPYGMVPPWLCSLKRLPDFRRSFSTISRPTLSIMISKIWAFTIFKLFACTAILRARDYACNNRARRISTFVSRLMEEEGICYLLRTSNGKHKTLILGPTTRRRTNTHAPTRRLPATFFAAATFVYGNVGRNALPFKSFRPGGMGQKPNYHFENAQRAPPKPHSGQSP